MGIQQPQLLKAQSIGGGWHWDCALDWRNCALERPSGCMVMVQDHVMSVSITRAPTRKHEEATRSLKDATYISGANVGIMVPFLCSEAMS